MRVATAGRLELALQLIATALDTGGATGGVVGGATGGTTGGAVGGTGGAVGGTTGGAVGGTVGGPVGANGPGGVHMQLMQVSPGMQFCDEKQGPPVRDTQSPLKLQIS